MKRQGFAICLSVLVSCSGAKVTRDATPSGTDGRSGDEGVDAAVDALDSSVLDAWDAAKGDAAPDASPFQWFATCGDPVCSGYQPNSYLAPCAVEVEEPPAL